MFEDKKAYFHTIFRTLGENQSAVKNLVIEGKKARLKNSRKFKHGRLWAVKKFQKRLD